MDGTMASPLTYDDLLGMKNLDDPQLSPDGSQVAYVVADGALEVGQPSAESRIWLVDAAGGTPRKITRGPGSDELPRWSPDGRSVAFCSDRAKRGTGRLYLLRGGIGEAEELTELPGGISDLAWSPDGATIAVVARDAALEHDAGADEILYEDRPLFNRIWLVDSETGESRKLSVVELHVWEVCWSPDGSALAAITSETPHRWNWYRAALTRFDVDSGEATTLHRPQRQIARPAWSPDGQWIAVTTSIWSDPGMTGGDILLVPAEGGDVRRLAGNDARSHFTVHWEPESRSLLTSALERGAAALCQVTLDGSTETLWREERGLVTYGMSMSRDTSTAVTVFAAFNEPPEVWLGRTGGDVAWTQLTRHNETLACRLPGTLETRYWNAADGQEIQGLLVRPNGVPADQLVPMVTMIHGGPTGMSGYMFPANGTSGWVPELLRRGIAVFFPNARGSAGWGLAFAEANQRDMGGADLQDILAGVDHVVHAGIADPERLGVCGWSYGGYLTAWAVTQTDRFKAAIAGASITNWVSFHGTSDIPAFDEVFYRANPYDVDGPYITFSPIFEVDRVTTPTLFLHGERDLICPIGQAKEMFRALRDRGVATECVIYPREGHPIRERAHRLDMLQRGVEWLCRWMGV